MGGVMFELKYELYKAREVADMLRLNTKTLYTWIRRDEVFCIRTPSGGIRIPREEVIRLLTLHGVITPGQAGVDRSSST
jgi:predicted site-specific integrase-resolvase